MPSAYSVHKCSDAQYVVMLNIKLPPSSVADPFMFDTDPDPRIKNKCPKNDLFAINERII